MKVSILSIGDELLFGEVVDTNAATIGGSLYGLGFKLPLQLTVGDTVTDIVEALQLLAAKCQAVVVTGGLGPTVDDVTAIAAATFAGSPLELNQQALAHLRMFAAKIDAGLHPANDKQALLPRDAQVVPNPVGTACGFTFMHEGCRFFFLPGVPVEMIAMLDETVLPTFVSMGKRKALRTKVFKVSGVSEAELDVMLQGVTQGIAEATIAFCVNFPEIEVKIRVEADEESTADRIISIVGHKTRTLLETFLFAEDGETIDTVVAGLFKRTGLTLSLAESCTGGLIAKRITDLSGSSAYFLQGLVTYSNEAKIDLLGVPQHLLDEQGAVSGEVAVAMAQGVRARSGSSLAVAVTGVAGPEGGSAEKPVGTVFMALADVDVCQVKQYHFYGDRDRIRLVTSFAALNWLRKELLARP